VSRLVVSLPGAALHHQDTRINECRNSYPAACCAHSPTLNYSATIHVQQKQNLIRHKIKFFEPYNNPCFLAIWYYVSKKSHLYCIYFTTIMCTAISDFTQYTFTPCRTCAIKSETRQIFPCGKENVMMGRRKNTAGRRHRRWGGLAAADRLPVCWILCFNRTFYSLNT